MKAVGILTWVHCTGWLERKDKMATGREDMLQREYAVVTVDNLSRRLQEKS
jgi:hypothetical protein